jgi:cellulose synthase/poly-beta-1,6-N-acetylglucosamine synthase-like glycosyltransferase
MKTELILSIVYFLLGLHYILFILKIYRGLNKLSQSDQNTNEYPYISVIIPFRNESANIPASVNSMINQDYPPGRFEVIYIDDNSDDDSLYKLNAVNKPANFRVLSVNENAASTGFKKRAVAFAINKAKGEIILTTDADCIHQPGWIRSMASLFDNNTGMAAGPVEFNEPGSLFGKIQQLEFRGLMLAGAGLIGSGTPVTCSAANLAYRKAVFNEVGGFNDNLNLSSGDDELLMQKIFLTGKYRVKFCISKDSLVKTNANKSLTDFFNQRKRWASKGIFYKDKLLVLHLILVFLYYLGILLSVAMLFISPFYFLLSGFSILGKVIPEYLVMQRGGRILFSKNHLKYIAAAELFQLIYILIAAFSGLWGNLKWKGRVVKR